MKNNKKYNQKVHDKMLYNIDGMVLKDGKVHIRGWATPSEKRNSTVILVRNKDKKKVDAQITRSFRPDVGMALFQDRKADGFGYLISADMEKEDKIFITFREISHITGKAVDSLTIRITKPAAQIQALVDKTKVVQEVRDMWNEEVKFYVDKALKRTDRDYQKWLKLKLPSQKDLIEQSKQRFAEEPKFSILVPVYNTEPDFLDDMIQSVRKQSYENWELCIANGSSDNEGLVEALENYASRDSRIKVVNLEKNLGIAENTNAALALAEGDFIALLDHDDILAPNALYEYVKALNNNPQIDAMYSDEDKVDKTGRYHFMPYFKSDLNMELLRVNNYICHFFAVRKSIVDQFGGFRSEFDGAQDYDFILRSVELAREVYHSSKILYHWRSHKQSTAENISSKKYAFEAGKRAIEEHFKRLGMNVTTEMGVAPGWYRNTFHLEYHPKVTIMIPTKDHIDDLEKCLNSLYTKATYDNYHVLVIENNSTEPETFAYYEEAKKKYGDLITVVTWEGPFNYSAINNFGAQFADGEYLLLLNNDTEVITPDFLERMLGLCMQKQTGIVGARMYFPDNTIQHAGVIVGLGGLAAHIFTGEKRRSLCYMRKDAVVQNLSAVTGACLLVKRSVYDELNGLDESFAVAYNDIDFCLRVREAGYDVVYQPDAELYHYESKSRGVENTAEKVERFNGEMLRFNTRWGEFLDKGDPFYNKNLALNSMRCELDLSIIIQNRNLID